MSKDTTVPPLHILVKMQNIMSIALLPLYVVCGLGLRSSSAAQAPRRVFETLSPN